jgi:signal transduction histidine kinase/ABC-type uncharacterized transport system substrate-binding protein
MGCIRSAVLAFGLFLSAANAPSFASETKRVLLLHSFGPDVKPWSDYARAIRAELIRQSPRPLDLHEHSLSTARSSDENPEVPFVQYLRALFSKHQPDLIVSIGAPAAAFVQRHRQQLFPAAPMLLTVVDQRRIRYSALTGNDAVVAVAIDYLAAFENILRVLPDTKSVVVVTGNSPIEQYWKEEIEKQVTPLTNRITLNWTNDLSFEELLKRAAALPPQTAIFWELMVVDAAGVQHDEGSALRKLHAVANAPIFSYTDAFFGREIVGGPHVPVLDAGQQTATAAMRILGGEKASDVVVPPVGMGTPKFDWREMQRWNISASSLPPGSEIHFREPSVWERYHWQIIGVLVALLIQAALIFGLLYERRRRYKAEIEARERMAELAHMNRHSVASGMSAAITHELNQPLGAILNNAETADIILNSDNPDLDELRTVLAEIKNDDWRASEIIRRLRFLISKNAADFKSLDLNQVVRDALAIVSVQARTSEVEIHQSLAPGSLLVHGDPIQLQQVVLNLAMNGIDAMQGDAKARRSIVAQTARLDDTAIEFSISDSGPGIASDKLTGIFEPFFTTKSTGMGLGLSLARTIIESHGGKLWAENGSNGGAVFRFRVPRIRVERAAHRHVSP